MLRRPERSAPISENRTVETVCGVCPGGCGVEARVEGGRLRSVRPLRDHPRGLVCPRGARAADIVHAPDRLLYPQLRTGGRLVRTAWDDAFTHVVARLRAIAEEYGPESVCIYTGRGNFELALNESFAPSGTAESSANAVLFPFGSPNATGVGSLCYAAYGMLGTRACFGDFMRHVHVDIEGADRVFVWGANPATDSPPSNLRRLARVRDRGGRVVAIDHRRSETARALDADWVGIRPGTDCALALGMMHVLIDEDLYDREFVERWTHGFTELVDYVRSFAPERVAAITGVPAKRVRELARALARERSAVLMYSGLEYSNCGVQAIRAVWCLLALAGGFDTPGGNLIKSPDRPRLRRNLTDAPEGIAPVGAAEYPLYCEVRNEAHAALLPRAILDGEPYPVRAMIISGSSVLTSWPNPPLWRRALAALDLLVVVNRFPTADAAYADVLLPAATGFETESVQFHDPGFVQLRQRVLEPLGESRPDYLIFAELASRLGYGHRWPQTEEGMVRAALEGTGVTIEELRERPQGIQLPVPPVCHRKYAVGGMRRDGRPGFDTPTGKFEIASEWLRAAGYDPLPVYTEPREGPLAAPEVAREFPLVLNSGARTQSAFRSQHYNIPALVKKQPWPLVHMHRDDAAARGIRDGDEVWLATPRGRLRFRARVAEDIVAGVVEANMGGGGPLGPRAWREANVNELTDLDNRDPISGFPVFKALLCEVRPA